MTRRSSSFDIRAEKFFKFEDGVKIKCPVPEEDGRNFIFVGLAGIKLGKGLLQRGHVPGTSILIGLIISHS